MYLLYATRLATTAAFFLLVAACQESAPKAEVPATKTPIPSITPYDDDDDDDDDDGDDDDDASCSSSSCSRVDIEIRVNGTGADSTLEASPNQAVDWSVEATVDGSEANRSLIIVGIEMDPELATLNVEGIGESTGRVKWTPTSGDAQSASIRVTVRDVTRCEALSDSASSCGSTDQEMADYDKAESFSWSADGNTLFDDSGDGDFMSTALSMITQMVAPGLLGPSSGLPLNLLSGLFLGNNNNMYNNQMYNNQMYPNSSMCQSLPQQSCTGQCSWDYSYNRCGPALNGSSTCMGRPQQSCTTPCYWSGYQCQ